jgi:two-component system response regulator FlrC
VRVVCATHQDLRLQVREGAFREDLFYRLRGVTVELPPLRARPQDILPLAEHFLPDRSFAPDARAALLAHPWPGNVRELRHVVQLASLLSEAQVIRAYALRFDDSPPRAWAPRVCEAGATAPAESAVELRGRTLYELEELAIRAALARHGGNRRAVSAELGIARSSLLRKLDALRLRG